MANKVKFGLKNVHYALVTETVGTSGTTTTYGTPKSWPGAVNLSLDPAGTDDENFDADDVAYYVVQGENQGYTGTFESALVPDDVETEVLGKHTDDDGVIYEKKDDVRKFIALLFEIDGDEKARRYALYKVLLSRNALTAATKVTNGSNMPQTDTANFTATPRPDDGLVMSKTGTASTTSYEGWFNAVYVPVVSGGEG